MRTRLLLAFAAVFLAMVVVTVRASLDRSVLAAAADLWADPWGRATLFDTYFGFLTVWLWIACRERGWPARIGWLLGLLLLGNLAIAGYFLGVLWRAPGRDWRTIFPRREELAP
jgi:hypothetical protein